jgi:signal transduction histidine kinase
MRASLDVARLDALGGWSETDVVLSDEVDRMTRLVADLLTLAKADEGALALRMEEVDIDDLVMEEARRLRGQTQLVVTTRVDVVQISADRARIAQALRNLIDNAARFAKHELLLTVSRSADGSTVTITVDDDGPGIPVAARDAVLRRFVRQDEARARDHGGTGLGLAITSEIVRLHHGTLVIADSLLGGAQVSITLPTGLAPTASSR